MHYAQCKKFSKPKSRTLTERTLFTTQALNEIIPLVFYRISMTSAMHNCMEWLTGNVLAYLYPGADLSSQNSSRILKQLGGESVQRDFFSHYLHTSGGSKKSVII